MVELESAKGNIICIIKSPVESLSLQKATTRTLSSNNKNVNEKDNDHINININDLKT